MTSTRSPGCIGFSSATDFDRFRERLTELEYPRGPRSPEPKTQKPENAFPYASLAGEGPLGTLVRLFHFCVTVEAQRAREALSPLRLEDFIAGGLLIRDGSGKIAATVRLQSHEGLLLASDLPQKIWADEAADHVVGVSGVTKMLANATVRIPRLRTLDIGTGCGVQALLAARHSEHVVGVDLSPRALALAEFNARLNGISNIEFREGSFFEPARRERFDLIVANPPFVISPESRFVYRDNTFEGDGLCRWFLEQAPAYLEEGGYFQMLCNWARFPGESAHERLAGWLENLGCDAWAMCLATDDPAVYAANWIRQTEQHAAEPFVRRFDAWMRYYRELGIAAISLGLIVLRRRSGVNWVRIEQCPDPENLHCGESVLHGMQHGNLHNSAGGEKLLDQRFRASEHVEWVRQHQIGRDVLTLASSRLKLTRGLPFEASAAPVIVRLLAASNGEKTLRTIVGELTSDGHLPDWNSSKAELLEAVRKLILAGFLVPVETPMSSAGIAKSLTVVSATA